MILYTNPYSLQQRVRMVRDPRPPVSRWPSLFVEAGLVQQSDPVCIDRYRYTICTGNRFEIMLFSWRVLQ